MLGDAGCVYGFDGGDDFMGIYVAWNSLSCMH